MEQYVAFLRGINVSGQKLIKMDRLREALHALSYEDVRTYIQSGNILFKRQAADIRDIENEINNKIRDEFGFDVPVWVLKKDYLKQVLDNNPFVVKYPDTPEKYYYVFLKEHPREENIRKLSETDYFPEEYSMGDRVVYFYIPENYGKAKMNNNYFERILKVEATTRNLKTITAVINLS